MKSLKKGFTLIELLVVITIIGILAVGGIGIFSTQLQKARDGTRMSDIKNYQTATEQYMSDNSSYPNPTDYTGSVKKYLSVLMQDPKEGQKNCLSGSTTQDCHYSYGAWNDCNGIPMGAFKLATTLEHVGDVTNYASGSKDAGTDDSLYEVFGACSGSTIPTSVFITK